MQELARLTIAEAARQIAAKEVSPVALTDALLERIQQVDGKTRAYVTVLADQARAAARESEARVQRGEARGPLEGIPLALKDLYDVAGVPTLCGSTVRSGHVAVRDSTVTRRLKDAGAIILGKTVTHEFAYGVISPPASNPWDLNRNPGGSSGGSGAATAADECLGAMGTDTGGSIRIPASLTGIVGFKATYGRVSKAGVMPLSWSLDNAGPLAKSVEDAAILLGCVAGADALDPCTLAEPVSDYRRDIARGVKGLRLGVVRNYFFDHLEPEVAARAEDALTIYRGLGAEVLDVQAPGVEHSLAVVFTICLPEGSEIHRRWIRSRANDYTPEVRALLRAGELMLGTHYLRAQRARALIQRSFRQLFETERLDALLTPALPYTAARHGQQSFESGGISEDVFTGYVRNCVPFSAAGLPALVLPCGFSREELPVSLQIAGRPFDEMTVLRVAHAYESATEWHRRKPPLR